MTQKSIGSSYRFIVNPESGRKVSIFGKKGRDIINNFMEQSGGGNDNHFPGEFFGNDSGRYSAEPQALGESAYGQQIAVSHGVESVEGMVGPDMGPSPNHSGVQTGGSSEFDKIINPRTGRKVSIFGKIGKNVIRSYIKQSMMGGAHDNHFPSEFFGNDSGRYSAEPQALGESAYGQQIAVSHGVESVEGMVGPDMGPSPNHSGFQTGGS